MGAGPKPPQAEKVICISKTKDSAFFEGVETAPDSGKVSIVAIGNPEYFTVGKSYAVVFNPLD